MPFEAMPEIEEFLMEGKGTPFESNSILEFVKPDLYLVVLDYSTADFNLSRIEPTPSNPRPDAPVWTGFQ